MKKLKYLKLNQLSKVELKKRQMDSLFGGTNNDNSCNCNCSSSTTLSYTQNANAGYGYQYSHGGNGTYIGITTCECYIGLMASTRGTRY